MENKIKVNAEVEELRLSIPTDKGTIVINNPKGELKNEMIKYMVECTMRNQEFDEKKIILELIDECTNVEFDMNIFDAVNLSHEAQMITNEILIIFQEIIGEASQVVRLVLQQTKNELEQKEIIEENKKIVGQIKEVVETEKEVEEVEKVEVPRKAIKKPQRCRGKISRR